MCLSKELNVEPSTSSSTISVGKNLSSTKVNTFIRRYTVHLTCYLQKGTFDNYHKCWFFFFLSRQRKWVLKKNYLQKGSNFHIFYLSPPIDKLIITLYIWEKEWCWLDVEKTKRPHYLLITEENLRIWLQHLWFGVLLFVCFTSLFFCSCCWC